MKRQLEIVCLIVWVVILCIVFAKNVPAEDTTPQQHQTKDGAMIRCIFTGGSWKDGVCTKPAVRNPPPSESTGCNPLTCMINEHGKCVNGVCVKQTVESTQKPAAKPKH